MNKIAPNYDDTIAFLRLMHPNRRWVLTAILPDAKPADTKAITATFDESRVEACLGWLRKHGERRNLYFSVGEVPRDVQKKADREDIARVWYWHADIDPRAGEEIKTEQERALAKLRASPGLPPPTCIVFSGGGYQGFWALSEPYEVCGDINRAEDAKLYNLAIELALASDNVHDVSRIMRMPGTVNRPDGSKRTKGRTDSLATLTEWNAQRVYALADFPKAQAPTSGPAAMVGPGKRAAATTAPLVAKRITSVNELPDRVSGKAKVTICHGFDPDFPKEKDDRSDRVLFVACELVRAGCDDDTIFGVLTDPKFPISESVLDKGRLAQKYAARQIARARAAVDGGFQTGENGRPLPNQHNIRLAITKLGVELSFDTFANRLRIAGLPDNNGTLDDAAVTRLWLAADEEFQLKTPHDFFLKVIEDAARQSKYHPVLDYLDSLTWDGTPRLDRWLPTYAEAEDTEFVRAAGALVLIAAVRRVRKPGVKFDEMLVLESAQGQYKSTALRTLAVRDDWFADDLPLNADTKRQIESLAGRWIVEAGELKGMRKGEVEAMKSFLSRQIDTARLAYGRLSTEFPRQCVIIGTTNSDRYLKDGTGNRRFWPVKVGKFDTAGLARDRDQLWAEAAQRESAGESIRLNPRLWSAAAEEQESRRVEDPFTQRLVSVLGELRGKLLAEDAWTVVGVPPAQRTQELNERLGACIREAGWDRRRLRIDGRPEWCYARGDKVAQRHRVVVTIVDLGRPVATLQKSTESEAPNGPTELIPF